MANVMGFGEPPPTQQNDFLQKLLLGLTGTPANAGAVDPTVQQAAQRQALLALGSNLLAGSGPSPQRQSFGQILGPSLMAAQQANQQGIDSTLKTQLLMSQIQRNKQKQQQNKTHVVGNALVDDTGSVIYQGQALDNVYGRVNPGDFTPESLAKFEKSKNWSDLERVWAPPSPTVVNYGGVPNLVQGDRNTGGVARTTPLSTQEVELAAVRKKAETEAAATAGGKITGERSATSPLAYSSYQAAVKNLESAMSGTATGPISGRMPAVTAAQQTAEGAEATMAPILKQLFRQAGEGTFTDKDQELLMKMVPTRKDHPEARKAKVAMIDEIVRAKLGIANGAAVPAAPAGNPQIDALLDKYAPK